MGTGKWGGKRIVRFWGGRRTVERALQTSFGGLRKLDSSGLCPFPGREQPGGGERVIGGVVQNHFGAGGFMVCFPSPEFSTPLRRSLNGRLRCQMMEAVLSRPNRK